MTAPTQDDAFQAAWGAYLDHLAPRDMAKEPCARCAESPTGQGCDTGKELYGTYRLARIGKAPESP